MKLKNKYEKIVEQYLIAFVEKQELDIDNCYWVADRIGEILSVNEQYYFSFNDIRFDVDNNVKERLIFRWQDECIENNLKVNYENYLKLNRNFIGIDLDINSIELTKNRVEGKRKEKDFNMVTSFGDGM